jgi:hypothetical protein
MHYTYKQYISGKMLSEKVTKALQNYTKGFSLRNEVRKCSHFIQQKSIKTRKTSQIADCGG